eukprot:m.7490 g.7490  ORF g.7490 m.7490 type:complete len:1951 (+) comp5257_c0_seq1:379-6231(+)
MADGANEKGVSSRGVASALGGEGINLRAVLDAGGFETPAKRDGQQQSEVNEEEDNSPLLLTTPNAVTRRELHATGLTQDTLQRIYRQDALLKSKIAFSPYAGSAHMRRARQQQQQKRGLRFEQSASQTSAEESLSTHKKDAQEGHEDEGEDDEDDEDVAPPSSPCPSPTGIPRLFRSASVKSNGSIVSERVTSPLHGTTTPSSSPRPNSMPPSPTSSQQGSAGEDASHTSVVASKLPTASSRASLSSAASQVSTPSASQRSSLSEASHIPVRRGTSSNTSITSASPRTLSHHEVDQAQDDHDEAQHALGSGNGWLSPMELLQRDDPTIVDRSETMSEGENTLTEHAMSDPTITEDKGAVSAASVADSILSSSPPPTQPPHAHSSGIDGIDNDSITTDAAAEISMTQPASHASDVKAARLRAQQAMASMLAFTASSAQDDSTNVYGDSDDGDVISDGAEDEEEHEDGLSFTSVTSATLLGATGEYSVDSDAGASEIDTETDADADNDVDTAGVDVGLSKLFNSVLRGYIPAESDGDGSDAGSGSIGSRTGSITQGDADSDLNTPRASGSTFPLSPQQHDDAVGAETDDEDSQVTPSAKTQATPSFVHTNGSPLDGSLIADVDPATLPSPTSTPPQQSTLRAVTEHPHTPRFPSLLRTLNALHTNTLPSQVESPTSSTTYSRTSSGPMSRDTSFSMPQAEFSRLVSKGVDVDAELDMTDHDLSSSVNGSHLLNASDDSVAPDLFPSFATLDPSLFASPTDKQSMRTSTPDPKTAAVSVDSDIERNAQQYRGMQTTESQAPTPSTQPAHARAVQSSKAKTSTSTFSNHSSSTRLRQALSSDAASDVASTSDDDMFSVSSTTKFVPGELALQTSPRTPRRSFESSTRDPDRDTSLTSSPNRLVPKGRRAPPSFEAASFEMTALEAIQDFAASMERLPGAYDDDVRDREGDDVGSDEDGRQDRGAQQQDLLSSPSTSYDDDLDSSVPSAFTTRLNALQSTVLEEAIRIAKPPVPLSPQHPGGGGENVPSSAGSGSMSGVGSDHPQPIHPYPSLKPDVWHVQWLQSQTSHLGIEIMNSIPLVAKIDPESIGRNTHCLDLADAVVLATDSQCIPDDHLESPLCLAPHPSDNSLGRLVQLLQLNDAKSTSECLSRRLVDATLLQIPRDGLDEKKPEVEFSYRATMAKLLSDRLKMRAAASAHDLAEALEATAATGPTTPKQSAIETLRGAFTTIIDSFERHVTKDLPVCNTQLINARLVHSAFLHLDDNYVLVVAADQKLCTRSTLQTAVQQLDATLQLLYGSPSCIALDPEYHAHLAIHLNLMFLTLTEQALSLSPARLDSPLNTGFSPAAHASNLFSPAASTLLPLSLRSEIHDTLVHTLYQGASLSLLPSGASLGFPLGTSLIRRGVPVYSSLCNHDASNIHRVLKHLRFITALSGSTPLPRTAVMRPFSLSTNTSAVLPPTASQSNPTSTMRQGLLVIVMEGFTLMATLFRWQSPFNSDCFQPTIALPSWEAFTVLHSGNTIAALDDVLSNRHKTPLVASSLLRGCASVASMSDHSAVLHHQRPESRDESFEVPSPSQGRRGTLIKRKPKLPNRTLALPTLDAADSADTVSTGRGNAVFHFVAFDAFKGTLVSSDPLCQPSGDARGTRGESAGDIGGGDETSVLSIQSRVLKNFHRSCKTIHDYFENQTRRSSTSKASVESASLGSRSTTAKVLFEEDDELTPQSDKKSHNAKIGTSTSTATAHATHYQAQQRQRNHTVYEHGICFHVGDMSDTTSTPRTTQASQTGGLYTASSGSVGTGAAHSVSMSALINPMCNPAEAVHTIAKKQRKRSSTTSRTSSDSIGPILGTTTSAPREFSYWVVGRRVHRSAAKLPRPHHQPPQGSLHVPGQQQHQQQHQHRHSYASSAEGTETGDGVDVEGHASNEAVVDEFYVCFRNGTSQHIVEQAFKIYFGL